VLSSEHTITYKTEEAEAGHGKILKKAEAFWQNKLEVEPIASDQLYPEPEAEAKNPKSEEAEANSEA